MIKGYQEGRNEKMIKADGICEESYIAGHSYLEVDVHKVSYLLGTLWMTLQKKKYRDSLSSYAFLCMTLVILCDRDLRIPSSLLSSDTAIPPFELDGPVESHARRGKILTHEMWHQRCTEDWGIGKRFSYSIVSIVIMN